STPAERPRRGVSRGGKPPAFLRRLSAVVVSQLAETGTGPSRPHGTLAACPGSGRAVVWSGTPPGVCQRGGSATGGRACRDRGAGAALVGHRDRGRSGRR